MPEIGVRELKARTSEIIRTLRDGGVTYTVTHRGRPVAILLPLAQISYEGRPVPDPWAELVRLGEAMSKERATDKDSAEILSEMRR